MKVFIQEFASGGGLSGSPLSADLLVEGFGMLRIIIENCKRLGFKVVTTLDNRLLFLRQYLSADEIVMVDSRSFLQDSSLVCEQSDYFLIIAPGTNGILQEMINNYQNQNKNSLNCSVESIKLTNDKKAIYKICSSKGIKIPKTLLVDDDNNLIDIEFGKSINSSVIELLETGQLQYPLILKPNDGVACEGLKLIKREKELKPLLDNKLPTGYLLQEYIYGDSISVTAYIWNDVISLLSINEQILSLGRTKSEYLGGVSNITHPAAKDILVLSEKILSVIDGLNGFVGIDLIVSKTTDNDYDISFIEINPRVTTPICGLLSRDKTVNLFPKRKIDYDHTKFDVTFFSKAKYIFPKKQKTQTKMDFTKDDKIITPPLSFDGQTVYCLLRGSGKNTREATAQFDEKLASISNLLKKEYLT